MKLSAQDLNHVLQQTGEVWPQLQGEQLFITGGTGFFGIWLLESFIFANRALGLGARAIVLTRDPQGFATRAPHLAAEASITLLQGNTESFEFPKEECSHFLHAATETNPLSAPLSPAQLFEANIRGTRRVLECATACKARNFLFTSSGATYGRQPSNVSHLGEDYAGGSAPLEPATAYGESKRASELLCVAAAQTSKMHAKIARCFAFVGPHLPLRANYAIGNFIADAMENKPIQIGGDGTPWRSYLYAADLVVWLWTILVRGQSMRAYNVGSDADLTILELARIVAEVVNPGLEIMVAQQPSGLAPQRYVPSVERARQELGLEVKVELREAISRTVRWYKTLSK